MVECYSAALYLLIAVWTGGGTRCTFPSVFSQMATVSLGTERKECPVGTTKKFYKLSFWYSSWAILLWIPHWAGEFQINQVPLRNRLAERILWSSKIRNVCREEGSILKLQMHAEPCYIWDFDLGANFTMVRRQCIQSYFRKIKVEELQLPSKPSIHIRWMKLNLRTPHLNLSFKSLFLLDVCVR